MKVTIKETGEFKVLRHYDLQQTTFGDWVNGCQNNASDILAPLVDSLGLQLDEYDRWVMSEVDYNDAQYYLDDLMQTERAEKENK